jgi:hypothetical protein
VNPAATAGQSRPDAGAEPLQTRVRPVGRVLSARQFWDLIERWQVPDTTALELLGFPGKLGKEGKRPRFRFSTRQQRITTYLPEIDAALQAAGEDHGWLHRKAAAFNGRTPLEHSVAFGTEGMAGVLQALNRKAMRQALSPKPRHRHSRKVVS